MYYMLIISTILVVQASVCVVFSKAVTLRSRLAVSPEGVDVLSRHSIPRAINSGCPNYRCNETHRNFSLRTNGGVV